MTSIGEDAFFGCRSLTDVYYCGSEEDWNKINIKYGNEKLTDATIHFNSILPPVIKVRNINNTDNITFNVHLDYNEEITGVVITALYDYDGKLIKVKSYKAESDIDCSFPKTDNAKRLKVFWWESIESLNSIANVKKLNFSF